MTTAAHGSAEWTAGLREATVECYLDRCMPTSIAPSAGYLTSLAKEVAALKARGFAITLELGIHYLPAWIRNQPGLRFTNQYGGVGGGLNIVWNEAARSIAVAYLNALATVVDFKTIDNIRFGAAGDVEFLYPAHDADGAHQNGYWAFQPDGTAQPGCPSPSWRPGDPAAPGAVGLWYDWYLNCLVGATQWLMAYTRTKGFTGRAWAVMPGKGAIPHIAQQSIDAGLMRYADVMARGAVWDKIVDRLAPLGFGIWCSSAAEMPGGTDWTQSTDAARTLTDPVWDGASSMRWLAYLAGRRGLAQAGENPGFPNTGYGPAMMANVVMQARRANWLICAWAHEHNLFDGSAPGVNLAAYKAAIR